MRRYLAAVAAAALLAGCGQPAQAPAPGETTPAAVTRVGAVMVVSHPSLEAVYEGFLEQLAKGGLIEGQNLEVDLQNPQGDQATMTSIANTFASSDYDYFLAIATPPAQALAQAISDRPVVFASVTDPVAAGLVTSMEAPGGNVTGTSDQLPTGEQLALIKEIDPSVETVGIDSGQAGGFEPPFPAHHFLLGADTYGLTSLQNLDRLPVTGATIVVAPLPIVGGTGSPTRVFALVER